MRSARADRPAVRGLASPLHSALTGPSAVRGLASHLPARADRPAVRGLASPLLSVLTGPSAVRELASHLPARLQSEGLPVRYTQHLPARLQSEGLPVRYTQHLPARLQSQRACQSATLGTYRPVGHSEHGGNESVRRRLAMSIRTLTQYEKYQR